MNLSKEKKEALWIIAIALVLHFVAEQSITKNSSGLYEGSGLFIGAIGSIFWFIGMLKYARAKGRSNILALILALFWIVGLFILILTQDLKKPTSNRSIK